MMRVAIIGAGPKGLFAAERLGAHLQQRGAEARITVFDPQPPGWGAGYRPDQPDWLRLNVNAAIVTADGRGSGRPSLGLPAFHTWRRERGERDPLDPFPPRALVGRYLADCWHELPGHLPAGVVLDHVARRVHQLTRSPHGWLIEGRCYDEVVLCTGHADDWPGALVHRWRGPQPLVPRVYPVERWLSRDQVPAGCAVACRGAALTFIDAALSLTQGRGGRFTQAGYQRSGDEPATIIPVGRRGAFLQVKPAPEGPLSALDLALPRARGLARCAASPAGVGTVLRAVWRTAQDYLVAAGVQDATLPAPGEPLPADPDPVVALRRSLQVALGKRAPGPAWALGQAWRDLYPAIVGVLGHDGCPEADWPRFAAAAALLEPLAFGPPPVNAAKLLALCEAGVIDARYLSGPWPDALRAADVAIDCVLPPPGLVEGQWPAQLCEAGVLVRGLGRRGVAVAADASCLGSDGTPIRGLAALGRLTEDVVIGNDTLSRTLHPDADRWADRVALAATARVGVTR
ncbi:MAG TPA: FAD/NAD(P)-binding protein, partial [Micropruina sp.]|nr:FAD/NAD(P)-binding protein [Micropruina sp.]